MTTLSPTQHTDWSALNRRLTDARHNGTAYRLPRTAHRDAADPRSGAPREPGGIVVLRPR